MRYSKILGTVWIVFAFYHLFFGFQYLYQYSTPGVLWLYMVPNWITFCKILTGTFSLLMGISTIRKRTKNQYLLFPFAALLLVYVLIDITRLGTEMIWDSGSNALLFFLSLITLKPSFVEVATKILPFKKKSVIAFLIIGLIPYLLNDWTSYDWFNFLH